nr:MAG TPA: exodeoxyribonuclease V [Caudoviricetes sp.]
MYCWLRLTGSGKSTLVTFIIAALGVDPHEDVAYVAFTGKAATVLAQKGCPNAITAHKLLYDACQQPDGSYIFIPKEELDKDFRVIVVDEVSMLPIRMWEQLLSHHIYILALGDPFQLPPISKNDDNHVLEHPHVFLDEIMRQAQESEIIRFSMHIREGKSVSSYRADNKEVMILSPKDLYKDVYLWADQVLCATNEKRAKVNTLFREYRGFGVEPEIGDKIIGLHNRWEFCSRDGRDMPLTNGTIGTITSFRKRSIWLPQYVSSFPYLYMYTNMNAEDGSIFKNIPIDYPYLKTGQRTLTDRQLMMMRKSKRFPYGPPYDFAYAYAITYWKAQGSQWDKVLALEEGHPFDRETHLKAIYTAITRASKKLVWVTRW